jgi:hypothetical protein
MYFPVVWAGFSLLDHATPAVSEQWRHLLTESLEAVRMACGTVPPLEPALILSNASYNCEISL